MRRRHLLALALVVFLPALAGCSPAGSLSMEPVDDGQLADRASVNAPDGEIDPERDRDAAVIRETIRNGSATITAELPPVSVERAFRSDDRFYDLSFAEAGTEPGYEVSIQIDYNTSDVDGDVVDYEDLPAADRRELDLVLNRPREPHREGYDFSVGVTYTGADAASSVLVPDQEYEAVRYEDEVYRLGVRSERTALTVYRYESTLLAESPEGYATQLRERYEFELSGLSDGERSIVDEAANGSYYAEDSDDEAFDALVDRFRSHAAVESDESHGSWVVTYEGQVYWAELDYGGYVDADSPSVTPPSATPPPE